jgi:DNA-binding transcriptional regulator YiaG
MTTERDVTDALARARELACEAVDAAPDGQSGYELAGRLTDAFRDAAAWTVNGLRGRAARRIRDDEALSLRPLAARLGVSKSLAQVWAAAEDEREQQDQAQQQEAGR